MTTGKQYNSRNRCHHWASETYYNKEGVYSVRICTSCKQILEECLFEHENTGYVRRDKKYLLGCKALLKKNEYLWLKNSYDSWHSEEGRRLGLEKIAKRLQGKL